ncbi:SRPBCC family protein [Jatrophihabitans sp.]|jgi:uncharacterized protein YndB with AHSA1/START domain|uniref:SRPBCC family protein n=1 Tax=Jatrophihabitans sp. TaxID=1932789 RepID=UPI002EF18B64
MNDLMTATVRIQAPAAAVLDVLLDAERLPDWNPAFLTVAPASPGTPGSHPIRVRGGLAGTYRYTEAGPLRVEATWEVPGLSETNYWSLRAEGGETVVEHGFRHRGMLAAVLRGAFATVARQRVDRLKSQVESG